MLAVLSLRGVRWAYVSFVLLGLLYFSASVGFCLDPQPCELTFDMPLAIYSLTNYQHIVRFALFFLMTRALLRMSGWPAFAWAAIAAIFMGALVEVAEGVTGREHCRLRDLIPDGVGALLGQAIVFLWNRVRMRLRPEWRRMFCKRLLARLMAGLGGKERVKRNEPLASLLY